MPNENEDVIELLEVTPDERKLLKEVVEARIRELSVLRANSNKMEREVLEAQAPILHALRERL